ncbi:hypothetical protein HLA87_02450 [Mycoplasma miroungigenitalium]|uniref:Uncharacterized protein n=1 Tax=Mycoplasma miroungigenitalium TaxID=754515 RepID=A0A6M4JB72_9MOLU|nr:hypothetical protein [Mycoplasma miroungigenitalium]QJR43635.1 hypothetical protein HLA87_02450 [Mycoplasma miroungigenitalium]
MFKTNNQTTLSIATIPTGNSDSDKNFQVIKYITELKHNYSTKKEDRVYFHNKGQSTSITTGGSHSLSVNFDYNDEEEAHRYLLSLLLGDATSVNNQFIKITLKNISRQIGQHVEISGKATINFKNHAPSGGADGLLKFELDILPQDDAWVVEDIAD